MGKSVEFDVSTAVARWRASGLISDSQAQVMLEELRHPGTPATPAHTPVSTSTVAPTSRHHVQGLVIEALGYLGGAIVVVALGMFVGYFWSGVSAIAQTCIIGATFAILMVAGLAVPQRIGDPAVRLRSTLWLAGTVAWACLIGFIADNFYDLHNESMAATAAWFTIPLAAGLWFALREPLQHIGFFVAAATAIGVSTYLLSDPDPGGGQEVWPGVAIWVFSLVWFGLAWIDRVRPAELGLALGAVGAIFAAMVSVEYPALAVMSVVMLAGFVVAAVVRRDFILLAIAALGTLQVLPSVIFTYFPGILLAAFVLLVVGVTLIAAAIYIARRRQHKNTIDLRDVDASIDRTTNSAAT